MMKKRLNRLLLMVALLWGGERDERGNENHENHEKLAALKNVNIKRENHENIENLDANLIINLYIYIYICHL